MCDCASRVHPGIECGAPGCECHPEEPTLLWELQGLLNKHSVENESGTPDYILADYLMGCLENFETTIAARARWRGESVELPALTQLSSEEDVADRLQ